MLTYLKGDATQPATEGNAIIVHVCNDIGAWGSGFVLAVSARWPEPETAYRKWAARSQAEGADLFESTTDPDFKLGAVQFVQVEPDVIVANLIGQHNVKRKPEDPIPVRYHAIRNGLARVRGAAILHDASVHMPRIGCGLAGGLWEEVEDLIINELVNHGVEVYVYDFG